MKEEKGTARARKLRRRGRGRAMGKLKSKSIAYQAGGWRKQRGEARRAMAWYDDNVEFRG